MRMSISSRSAGVMRALRALSRSGTGMVPLHSGHAALSEHGHAPSGPSMRGWSGVGIFILSVHRARRVALFPVAFAANRSLHVRVCERRGWREGGEHVLPERDDGVLDRKSTRLNSSHANI